MQSLLGRLLQVGLLTGSLWRFLLTHEAWPHAPGVG